MNVPNGLTLLRALLVPVVIILVIYDSHQAAFFVLLLAGLTDLLDGLAARLLGQVTPLGACLDPVADKLLVVSIYITLGVAGLLPAWLAVVVVSRDVLLFLGSIILFVHGVREALPSLGGKAATFLQIVTACAALLYSTLDRPVPFGSALVVTTGAVTVLSGLQYVFGGLGRVDPFALGNHPSGKSS